MWLRLIQFLVFPVSIVYNIITSIRNFLYDTGFLSTYSPPLKTIGVGNLSMGGTGKTPMIEYLVRHLNENHKVAVLSRGYKRKSKGFVLAGKSSTVDEIGDELFQIYQKFGNSIYVAADANRQRGIQNLCNLSSPPQIILLDDIFQHRKVKVGYLILLSSFDKPFFDDHVFPSGFLRENRTGRKRADHLIVSKCDPSISEEAMIAHSHKLNLLPKQNLGFTSVEYGKIYSLIGEKHLHIEKKNRLVVVTGFVQTEMMLNHLSLFSEHILHLPFSDHHNFNKNDFQLIENKYVQTNANYLVVSEKDAARLINTTEIPEYLKNRILVLPIIIKFVNQKDEDLFNFKIKEYVDKN